MANIKMMGSNAINPPPPPLPPPPLPIANTSLIKSVPPMLQSISDIRRRIGRLSDYERILVCSGGQQPAIGVALYSEFPDILPPDTLITRFPHGSTFSCLFHPSEAFLFISITRQKIFSPALKISPQYSFSHLIHQVQKVMNIVQCGQSGTQHAL